MKRGPESVIAGILLLLSVVYGYGITLIEGREFATNEIGPTLFPWVLTGILAALGMALFFGGRAGAPKEQREAQGKRAGRKTAGGVLLLIAYAVSLQPVGFLWTTPVFLGLFSFLCGLRRAGSVAGVSLGTTLLVYLLMKHAFGLILP
jgi:hypothetical protein